MNIYVLDTTFQTIGLLDVCESFIWTDRHREYGDFEIYTFPSEEIMALIEKDYYLFNPDSEHLMIIECREITTDNDDGPRLIVTGRSLESLLNRRVIWSPTTISGSLQDGIEKLLNENIISPSDSNRKISNFTFKKSTDTRITSLTHEQQYTPSDNLYDVIVNLCENYDLGFKVIWIEDNKFEFSLYKGIDRSYAQETLPYVVFSPDFDNILTSDYTDDSKDYKNVARVAGSGNDSEKVYASYGDSSGLNRREVYIEASDISKKDESNNDIPDAEYNNLLVEKGKTSLADYKIVTGFEAEIDSTAMYIYGTDYSMGDVVQLKNEYGIEDAAQITEFVFSHDDEGEQFYPTFTKWEDKTDK